MLLKRLEEPRRFIQVLSGPRQVGKTTIVQQVINNLTEPVHYATADHPGFEESIWIEQQWDLARHQMASGKKGLLVLDEVQKVSAWSSVVKKLWDEDTLKKIPLKVVLLGSSPLLIQKGLTESLAGRFETLFTPHWSFPEMKKAFGWTVEQYIFFGGYPGAASLIQDEERWTRYIMDSLIETTISRDILLMNRVDKPALLRRLFTLGCQYSGQILSFQKMMGQLQDAGNTTTLSHYLDLLSGAGMLTGLQKYSEQKLRQRASSPKFQVFNTALMTAQSQYSFQEALQDHSFWGRLVESAIGAHLINHAHTMIRTEVSYWREGNEEVDFIFQSGKKLMAIEVKSGRTPDHLSGLEEFSKRSKPTKKILVGKDGIPIEKFLSTHPQEWLT